MTNQFDITLYNDEFFKWHQQYTIEYQTKTFQWYIETFKPKSVVDFGCGIGTYLDVAFSNGITQLKGFDIGGEFAKKYTPIDVQCYIEYLDCTKQIHLPVKYDCVLSFETAEHIEPSGTDQFVSNIINAAGKRILFTAAPPGQEGCGHINMHQKYHWIDLFIYKSGGAVKYDEGITEFISEEWKNIGCPTYISDNLLIFKKQ